MICLTVPKHDEEPGGGRRRATTKEEDGDDESIVTEDISIVVIGKDATPPLTPLEVSWDGKRSKVDIKVPKSLTSLWKKADDHQEGGQEEEEKKTRSNKKR